MAYCLHTDVKLYLGIKGSGDDTLIDDLITRAQATIDTFARRSFEASADTTRNFDAVADTNGRTLIVDKDLASITTVTNGDGNTISSSNYVTEPRNDTPYRSITILGSSTSYWQGATNGDNEDAISIAGKWAYSTSAPDDIKHACILLASWLYRRKDSIGSDADRPLITGDGVTILPSTMPAEVQQIIKRYRRLV